MLKSTKCIVKRGFFWGITFLRGRGSIPLTLPTPNRPIWGRIWAGGEGGSRGARGQQGEVREGEGEERAQSNRLVAPSNSARQTLSRHMRWRVKAGPSCATMEPCWRPLERAASVAALLLPSYRRDPPTGVTLLQAACCCPAAGRQCC
jgi:hypothetical protein